jgi:hypothetical protein
VTPFANRRGVANLAYWVTGTEGSNPSLSTPQSPGLRTSRRIDRNLRVCARFALMRGPGEYLYRLKLAESGETYPGPILPGPRIIAIHSRAVSERQIRRSTSISSAGDN